MGGPPANFFCLVIWLSVLAWRDVMLCASRTNSSQSQFCVHNALSNLATKSFSVDLKCCAGPSTKCSVVHAAGVLCWARGHRDVQMHMQRCKACLRGLLNNLRFGRLAASVAIGQLVKSFSPQKGTNLQRNWQESGQSCWLYTPIHVAPRTDCGWHFNFGCLIRIQRRVWLRIFSLSSVLWQRQLANGHEHQATTFYQHVLQECLAVFQFRGPNWFRNSGYSAQPRGHSAKLRLVRSTMLYALDRLATHSPRG